MGMFLTKPSTNKHSDQGGDFDKYGVRFGVSGMQGWRVSMEDAHLALPRLDRHPELSLFGVFDGHGGSVISEWVSRHIDSIFQQELDAVLREMNSNEINLGPEKSKLPNKVVAISEALQRTYIKLDEQMASPSSRPEQKAIYEKKKSSSDTNPPKTFLQELLGGIDGQRRVLRMVEQNGNRCLQIVSFNGDEESGSSENEKVEEGKVEEVDESKESSDRVEDSSHNCHPTEGISSAGSDENGNYSDGIKPFESDIKRDDGTFEESNTGFIDDDGLADDDGYLEDISDSGTCGPEHCGTTAVVAVILPDENDGSPYLIVANAGDSRAVLSRSGQAIALSHDHKPELPLENERILKAHGTVENGRVDGNLNMSRTLGDLQYKSDTSLSPEEQKITAFPDVRIIPLTSEDEFIVLACDGIWDVVDNQLCVDIVRRKILKQIEALESEYASKSEETNVDGHKDREFGSIESKEQLFISSKLDGSLPIPALTAIQLSKICEEICDECLAPNPVESEGIGCDNMTLMIVQLGPNIRKKSSNCMVSTQIGSAVARRLNAAASAIETQISQMQQANPTDSNSGNSSDDDGTLRNEQPPRTETQNRKAPDAVLNAPLPSVSWIPKKEFNVTLYGYGVDDGRFDNVPEGRL
ncbi:PPM1G-PROV domain-containing protein [Cryptosporidium ubiquitum]|uniref:PPM1G-PROV domain-containing protein n=1 Tax=Cryptosporidium ubiquitum TaxID=857276 RepID=A0A1J4M9G4_9CRYT|nr:PPM1G-PROV domain-containing protein [Cryptosporidium ubiquitum]OII70864.1 PPM1G-PROV domain-containing protein [Cryptosporidium ubiquitum]